MNLSQKLLGFLFLVIVLGGAVVWAVTDRSEPRQVSNTNTLQVATTLPPYATFIERIGGEHVNVQTMVPADQSPHVYEPTPRQLQNLQGTDIYFTTGTQINFEEQWLDDILDNAGNPRVVNTADGVTLLENDHDHDHNEEHSEKTDDHSHEDHENAEEHAHSHDTEEKDNHTDAHSDEHKEENSHEHDSDKSFDPHVWTSPKRALKISENIKNALLEVDPERQSAYEENYTRLREELTDLDRQAQDLTASQTRTLFIVDHPAWSYFAEDYGVEQLAIEEDGKEPSSRRLQEVIRRAQENTISRLIHDPNVNRRAVEVVANELPDAEIIEIRPGAKDYFATLSRFLSTFNESS